MKKILVLGRAGMLGHVVYEKLGNEADFSVVGCARQAVDEDTEVVDVADMQAVEELVSRVKPDLVVNCVGVLVKGSSDSVSNAILLNSYLPHHLASLGNKYDFKLIHVSTDCVFSGGRGDYRDSDICDGETPYARTKTLGEVNDEKNLTIRTSIIGPELKANGTGLLDWFLKQTDEVGGFSQAYWSGVTTIELAKAIVEFIRQDIRGLYQFTVEPKINKCDLLNLFKSSWGIEDITVVANPNYVCDKSMLSDRSDFVWQMPTHAEMVDEMKLWSDDHADLYPHYKR